MFRAEAVRELRYPWSHPAREPLLDLLQHPTVAVGIAERRIRGIGAALRIRPRGMRFVASVKARAEAAAGIVEWFAHLDAVSEQFAAGRVDIRHYQNHTVDRARPGRGDSLAQDD